MALLTWLVRDTCLGIGPEGLDQLTVFLLQSHTLKVTATVRLIHMSAPSSFKRWCQYLRHGHYAMSPTFSRPRLKPPPLQGSSSYEEPLTGTKPQSRSQGAPPGSPLLRATTGPYVTALCYLSYLVQENF